MMNRFLILLLLVIIGFNFAHAQSVVPLMRDASLKTHVALPFKLLNAQNQAQNIFDVKLASANSSCQVMVDPFIPSNFFVKCLNPGSILVSVFYYNSGEYVKINYGPFNISRINDSAVGQPTNGNSPYAAGSQLFVSYCIECHSPVDKANRSVSSIKSAISSQPRMRSIILSNEQVQAISDYLGNL